MSKEKIIQLEFQTAKGNVHTSEFPVYDGEGTYETFKSIPGNENKTEADFFEFVQGTKGDSIVGVEIEQEQQLDPVLRIVTPWVFNKELGSKGGITAEVKFMLGDEELDGSSYYGSHKGREIYVSKQASDENGVQHFINITPWPNARAEGESHIETISIGDNDVTFTTNVDFAPEYVMEIVKKLPDTVVPLNTHEVEVSFKNKKTGLAPTGLYDKNVDVSRKPDGGSMGASSVTSVEEDNIVTGVIWYHDNAGVRDDGELETITDAVIGITATNDDEIIHGAIGGYVVSTLPDGTKIQVMEANDETIKLKLTKDGEPVVGAIVESTEMGPLVDKTKMLASDTREFLPTLTDTNGEITLIPLKEYAIGREYIVNHKNFLTGPGRSKAEAVLVVNNEIRFIDFETNPTPVGPKGESFEGSFTIEMTAKGKGLYSQSYCSMNSPSSGTSKIDEGGPFTFNSVSGDPSPVLNAKVVEGQISPQVPGHPNRFYLIYK